MDKDLGFFLYSIKKYIYTTVYFWYWVPMMCAQLLTSFIVIFISYAFVNHWVLKPIKEMSQMTQFILHPEYN